MASHEKDKGTQHGAGGHSGKPSDMNKQHEQQAGKTSQAGGSEEDPPHGREQEGQERHSHAAALVFSYACIRQARLGSHRGGPDVVARRTA